ncbi:MAG: cytochrome c3 family protein [Planctomycetota bacterium]
MQTFVFPNWVNRFTVVSIVGGLAVAGYLATCRFGAIHPDIINVGPQPKQPVPFSHRIHAGQLKLDCRYCHNTVEKTGFAAIPATATCGNCHGGNRVKEGATLGIVKGDSPLLEPVRVSLETKNPVLWEKVHDVPDFVYFNHSAHINRGVSCVSCHGRIDTMEVVTQVEPLSMKWCLDCHRNPEPNIRDPQLVTALDFKPEDPEAYGKEWAKKLGIKPNVSCSTCHR